MWKNISIFLGGLITGLLIFLKMKEPDVIQVDGDLIESQKVKDNSKQKLSRKERRANRKAEKKYKRSLNK